MMVKSINIQIKGALEVINSLSKKNKIKQKNINNAIHNAGFFLQTEVKESIAGRRSEKRSVDTGQFLQSVETDNSKSFQSDVSSNVKQAIFMEMGTTRIPARRHFRNSAIRNRDKINRYIADATNKKQ